MPVKPMKKNIQQSWEQNTVPVQAASAPHNPHTHQISSDNQKTHKGVVLGTIAFTCLILAGAAGAYSFHLHKQTTNIKNQLSEAKQKLAGYESDPSIRAKEEARQVVDRVGQLIILPADESPTVATVTDLEALKDQAFFANAQIGDKVLIYANAGKAILYRPSENKVIEKAPMHLQNTNEQASSGGQGKVAGSTTTNKTPTTTNKTQKQTVPSTNSEESSLKLPNNEN